ncbi:hypothetical protein N7478_002664 [Penicillium angulare]|uniref:uncharacterized protein n=1 Tax=Penicillium angulare TaxID=116970 RepID=UPI002541F40F|nr:uncharacterized protein N7478_002664 [Penicillium angulare]KAJ5286978.1 hypothetical protein N7478_002664 [Penicillium angulare]
MSEPSASTTPTKSIGFREFCEFNEQTFSRLRGTNKWTKHYLDSKSHEPPPSSSPLEISLVIEDQGEGEPRHWSLFVGHENEAGHVYQVTGDAEFMKYEPSNGPVDISLSPTSFNVYNLAQLTEQQARVVQQLAEQECPPKAQNRQAVVENCQGWTLRVIHNLAEMCIIPIAKYDMASSMLQPV